MRRAWRQAGLVTNKITSRRHCTNFVPSFLSSGEPRCGRRAGEGLKGAQGLWGGGEVRSARLTCLQRGWVGSGLGCAGHRQSDERAWSLRVSGQGAGKCNGSRLDQCLPLASVQAKERTVSGKTPGSERGARRSSHPRVFDRCAAVRVNAKCRARRAGRCFEGLRAEQ